MNKGKYVQLDLFTEVEMWSMALGPVPTYNPDRGTKPKSWLKRKERRQISKITAEEAKASIDFYRPLK